MKTEYTREKPFTRKGSTFCTQAVYPLSDNGVSDLKVAHNVNGFATDWRNVSREMVDAALAFRRSDPKDVLYERTGWHWTNDDHTEARNGRWAAKAHVYKPGEFMISHEDFPTAGLVDTEGETEHHERVAAPALSQATTFATWRAEQDVPEEPTGLGAVVEVSGMTCVRVYGPGDDQPWFLAPGDWFTWFDITKRGPVTVLSEGVTP